MQNPEDVVREVDPNDIVHIYRDLIDVERLKVLEQTYRMGGMEDKEDFYELGIANELTKLFAE